MTEKQIAMILVAPMIIGMAVAMWRQGHIGLPTAGVVSGVTVFVAALIFLT